LESLSSTTYGQASCGTKRKTEKEVQADPQLAVSTITSTTNVSTDTIPIWSYDYLSSPRKHNQYSSMVLPRFCFLQVDYLSLYMTQMPTRILPFVNENFNCEDIATSFFVS
jgi:hypothetical protein